ncbi:hypothetical protein DUNSADRAFT_4934 [Dunaliella salina]|uniref:Uncharacterized protein n=1 Tax=Dunaliella salina TaxID=3046 RepID=A0ABQ7FUK0_DUNSA|nr:hypothetical protein DUNSADRAFT_4934 [Dunaliella salina]|eukprot:KAF5826081.1 hypothetical protein DUNSADRAFT_4934 [Dunaliella salina]
MASCPKATATLSQAKFTHLLGDHAPPHNLRAAAGAAAAAAGAALVAATAVEAVAVDGAAARRAIVFVVQVTALGPPCDCCLAHLQPEGIPTWLNLHECNKRTPSSCVAAAWTTRKVKR